MPAVSCDNVRRTCRDGTFHDFVVGRIGGNGLELARDRNNVQESKQLGQSLEALVRAERQLGLEFFGELVKQFAARRAIHDSGAGQFDTLERLALPTYCGE